MPTFGGEITPLLGMWYSRLTNYVVEKSTVPGLDFKLKGGRCDLKRNLVFTCFTRNKLKGTGKARNQVILLVIYLDQSSLG